MDYATPVQSLPHGPTDVAAELIQWIDANQAQPLEAETVPGASTHELRRLATLGAVAKSLAQEATSEWPKPLSLWAEKATPNLPDAIAKTIKKSIIGTSGYSDVLAETYERLVSGRNRRLLGTFFTPPPIVKYMIQQAKNIAVERPQHIIDPGAGVGAFTTAARDAWPTARIISVDLNVVTLGLLATRVAVERRTSRRSRAHRIELIHDDYLTWLQRDWPTKSGPRLVIGNPPYTRHQEMTEASKLAARSAAGPLITSGLAGLSAYFLAATIRALDSEDYLVLLLPGSWLETRYGRELREWLWHSSRRRVELDLFPSQVEVFPGTQVTAMVLSLGPERRSRQPFIVRAVDLDTSLPLGTTITRQAEIRPNRSTTCPPTFTRFVRIPEKPSQKQVLNLGEVAKIRRGVATGANHFFFVSEHQRCRAELPEQFLRPALVKASHCRSLVLTSAEHEKLDVEGIPRWLLDLNGWNQSPEDVDLIAYLQHGEETGAHMSYLASKRRDWYVVERVSPPDLFIAPVGKNSHRVIVNEVGAIGSNNLYGIYLSDVAPWTAHELATYLIGPLGQATLRALAREYQGGSSKIEPKSLRSLEVPESLPSSQLHVPTH